MSKYLTLNYDCPNKIVTLRIQSWFCPECGVHGALSELLAPIYPEKTIVDHDYPTA